MGTTGGEPQACLHSIGIVRFRINTCSGSITLPPSVAPSPAPGVFLHKMWGLLAQVQIQDGVEYSALYVKDYDISTVAQLLKLLFQY